MQFLLMLALLGALAISECGASEPVAGAAWRLLFAAVGIAGVAVAAAAAARRTVRRLSAEPCRQAAILQRFRWLRRAHAALWLATSAGILYGLDWGRLVRFNWHLGQIILVDELAIFAPVILPLVLSWAAFYEVDRAVRAGADESGTAEAGFPTRGQYVAFHVRHFLGALLVPLLGLLAVQDGVRLFAPAISDSGYDAAVLLPSLAAMLLLFPTLLRFLWETQRLPAGALRSRLEQSARRAGCRVRDIFIWRTRGMVVNAAMAGMIPRWRYVFLSDALLCRLTDDEVEAVFGHEIGHVRHHHLLLRIMIMMAPLSLWFLFEAAFPDASEQVQRRFGQGGLRFQAEMGLVLLSAVGIYMFLVFGSYSRLLEHQADLFGCRLLRPDAELSALERFVSALEKVASAAGMGRNTPGWQHASIARRVDFLAQLSRDQKRELHFQRRVRLLGFLLAAIVLSPLIYHLLAG